MRSIYFGVLLGASLLSMQRTTPAQNWFHPLPAVAPSPRQGAAMAYDSQRGRVILFGGLDNVGANNIYFDDTWEWDGATWHQLAPAAAPPARVGHAMAYDAQRGRTVLFGGQTYQSGYTFWNDTWEWDGVTWSQLTPANAPVRGGPMVYDAQRGRTVMFAVGSSGWLSDTWEWDGANWTQRITPGAPSFFGGVAMAYDAQRGRTVLFGGGVLPVAQTWEWDGVAWSQLTPATAPASRNAHAMAYDQQRGRTVLFGGIVGSSYQPEQDTWEWDGANWSQLTPAFLPPGKLGHAMAWDGQRGLVMQFGGVTGHFTITADTLEYGDPLATARPFGSGCGQPALALTAGSLPLLGTNVIMSISNVPAAMAFMTAGLGTTSLGPFPLPLPLDGFGLTGCTLYQDMTLATSLPCINQGPGLAQYTLVVPNVPALLDLIVYLQAWAPAPGVNPAGIVSSNALELANGNH